jgi:hypothetical protein
LANAESAQRALEKQMVEIQGLDEEQAQLGASDKFWTLISNRRKEPTIDSSTLEKKLDG